MDIPINYSAGITTRPSEGPPIYRLTRKAVLLIMALFLSVVDFALWSDLGQRNHCGKGRANMLSMLSQSPVVL